MNESWCGLEIIGFRVSYLDFDSRTHHLVFMETNKFFLNTHTHHLESGRVLQTSLCLVVEPPAVDQPLNGDAVGVRGVLHSPEQTLRRGCSCCAAQCLMGAFSSSITRCHTCRAAAAGGRRSAGRRRLRRAMIVCLYEAMIKFCLLTKRRRISSGLRVIFGAGSCCSHSRWFHLTKHTEMRPHTFTYTRPCEPSSIWEAF